ncbi:MAG: hypothetical protein QXN71_02230 [Candidatus Aenigmatarchaeota archaeon]
MFELALFVALVGSVCFLTYEFYKINKVYQERLHYYRFLPGLGMSDFSKELDKYTINSELKTKIDDIGLKMREIQARIERQEAVIEKLIKGLSE